MGPGVFGQRMGKTALQWRGHSCNAGNLAWCIAKRCNSKSVVQSSLKPLELPVSCVQRSAEQYWILQRPRYQGVQPPPPPPEEVIFF